MHIATIKHCRHCYVDNYHLSHLERKGVVVEGDTAAVQTEGQSPQHLMHIKNMSICQGTVQAGEVLHSAMPVYSLQINLVAIVNGDPSLRLCVIHS